ncbi:hypothetical protein PV04_02837 [Phialophora macrospora]|uniref:Uncharacterized protein n=1 Tax=Phialophora macrospora TaxID=1851006 RepID=A0A0D2CZF3_9EURO|nr:hypothetical protein PV04_02837 [Phialophora macrospora]
MRSLRLSTSTLRVATSSTFHRPIPQSTLLLTRNHSTAPIPRPSTQPQTQTQAQPEPPPEPEAQREPQSRAQRDIQSKRTAQLSRTFIDRQSTEYTSSGTDDAVAAQQVSYTPNTGSTSNPSEAIPQAAEEAQQQHQAHPRADLNFNPLENSPANTSLSRTTSYEEGSSISVSADGDQLPTPAAPKTYMGTTTQKSKSAQSTISRTSEKKKVFAGSDTRKNVRPGAEQRELEQQKGKGPVMRPGPR